MKLDNNELINELSNPATRHKAFSIIVDQYSQLLYWKIRRIVLFHDDANDVLQETFIKAWNGLDNFKNKSKLSTWLYRIAINESLDFIRHKNQKISMSIDDDDSIANTLIADNYFDGDETQAQLQQAISKLPEVQRIVFNMRYFDKMKYSEMSEILGTTEGSLKASYHIAVQKITDFFNHND